ncbi:GILT-like protein 1 isoform X3 [Lepeophtheirus salmonis]|uniref:GILT-like protein 1 isoform X3 n=1 Tax=Lepeophtheirus salmonis TaxID=72036 RepID=UPI001AE4E994|nr:GILT-like protein 1 isoform X3 [Lepeophtheirus salmonis]
MRWVLLQQELKYHWPQLSSLGQMKNQHILSITILVLIGLVAPGKCNNLNEKEAAKVNITLYYETRCPDCIRYDTQTLYPTYKLLQDIMNIQFIPYGKANTTAKPDGFTFICQHGPTECLGNMVHACAIQYVELPILADYINCMTKISEDPINAGKTCSESLSLPWTKIQKCVSTLEGEILLAQYGEITHALTPKLTSVPTVELNGSQDNQDALINDLKGSVCSAYTGVKPSACT